VYGVGLGMSLGNIHILEDKTNHACPHEGVRRHLEVQIRIIIIIIINIIAVNPEVLGVDGRIILKQILRKQDGRAWTVFIWLRIDK
jgi:hypothetical protein